MAALNNLGRFAEALDVSEELARDEPDLKGVAHVRGYALSRLGRYSEAAQAFEQARLEDRESYQSVLELALTRHRQGRDPEALKLILEWPVPPAEMDRRDRVFRGELLIRLGWADDALAGLLLFVDPDDSEPQGHYNLGWALFKTGRYAEAVESFDRAMACGMDTVELHSNRVRCLRLAGRGEAALPAAEALVERDPGNVDALLDLALLQREASRPLEALAAAERAWRIQPDAPDAAVLYALCLCQFDRLELALEVLQDSPTRDATTLAVLGQVLVRLQRYTAGLRLLDESLRLGAGGDNDSAVHKYRADALTMLGRYAEARDAATRGSRS